VRILERGKFSDKISITGAVVGKVKNASYIISLQCELENGARELLYMIASC